MALVEKPEIRPTCDYPVGMGKCGSEDGLHTVKGNNSGIVCDKHRIDVIKTWDWSDIERIERKR